MTPPLKCPSCGGKSFAGPFRVFIAPAGIRKLICLQCGLAIEAATPQKLKQLQERNPNLKLDQPS